MRFLHPLLFAILVSLGGTPATSGEPGVGARPEVVTQTAPMQVVVVREAAVDCAGDCAEWISAEGRFVASTPAEFRRVFREIGDRRLPILLHSPGGMTGAALEIGRMIRARHLDVSVGRTTFEACAEPDCRGVPAGARRGIPGLVGLCHSACVYALVGGERRLVGHWASVGVHQAPLGDAMDEKRCALEGRRIVAFEARNHEECELPRRNLALYGVLQSYFDEMGLKPSILEMVLATPSSSIRVLSRDELTSTRVATEIGDARLLMPTAVLGRSKTHLPVRP